MSKIFRTKYTVEAWNDEAPEWRDENTGFADTLFCVSIADSGSICCFDTDNGSTPKIETLRLVRQFLDDYIIIVESRVDDGWEFNA